MAKLHSLLWFTALSTTMAMTALVGCESSTEFDDGEGGGGGQPSGGTAGTSGGSGGTSGSPSAGAGGTDESSSGAGGAPAAGAGGSGGAPPDKVCGGDAGGAAGVGGATGETCTDYCTAFFAVCGDYVDAAGFTSESDCLTRCQLFDQTQLCCRAFYTIEADGAAGAAGAASASCIQAAGDGTRCN